MKPQLILLALLQAQAALSKEGAPIGLAATLPDCATPCKAEIGLSAADTAECIQSNCGSQHAIRNSSHATEFNAEENAQAPSACEARCLRLRFSRERQQQCIADCGDQDGGPPPRAKRSEEEAEERENLAPRPNACQSRCLRLRFSRERQQQCLEDCDSDEDEESPREERRSDSNEGEQNSDRGNRRRRRRSSPYDWVGMDDDPPDPSDGATIDFDAGEDGENPPQAPSACEARCLRLRMSRERQQQCIADCGERDDGSPAPSAKRSEEGGEGGGDLAPRPNACQARCLRLRFSRERQQQCLEDCDSDSDEGEESPREKRRSDEEGEEVPGAEKRSNSSDERDRIFPNRGDRGRRGRSRGRRRSGPDDEDVPPTSRYEGRDDERNPGYLRSGRR